MLPAFKGRINRKTFVMGNAVGLAVLGFVALIYIVPVAIIDILVSGAGGSSPIFKFLYGLYGIPAIFYGFFAAVLFVKRMHDIGYPGLLLLGIFFVLEIVSHLADIWVLNILGLVMVLGVCALPGQKIRNSFGPVPQKKFHTKDIVVKF
ncbi:MAG: DUF805 domain-containing protein [Candidatus Saccharimonadales bacterium]